jgi:hypothetical protein
MIKNDIAKVGSCGFGGALIKAQESTPAAATLHPKRVRALLANQGQPIKSIHPG